MDNDKQNQDLLKEISMLFTVILDQHYKISDLPAVIRDLLEEIFDRIEGNSSDGAVSLPPQWQFQGCEVKPFHLEHAGPIYSEILIRGIGPMHFSPEGAQ